MYSISPHARQMRAQFRKVADKYYCEDQVETFISDSEGLDGSSMWYNVTIKELLLQLNAYVTQLIAICE